MSPTHSWLDLKLGVRMLAKYPGLTAAGVLGMAVAIAIGAGVFSVLHAVFDPALPLEGGDRIVAIRNVDVETGAVARSTHAGDLETWRRALPAVRELGAYRLVDRNLVTADGEAQPLRVAEMTASGFRIARVPPLLGRYLVDADERAGAAPVLVIGYEVWRSRFGGDPAVLGRAVRLGATPYTVVGVMPEGFAFPLNNGLWTPLRLDALRAAAGAAPAIDVFGRLAPGATLEGARAELETVGRRLSAAEPATHEHLRPRVMPYTRALFGSAGLPWEYWLFQLLVGLLLLVIAVNVAILVYARTATRTGEIAVRLALGASRARVVSQLFVEALVLAGPAVVLGLGAAALALRRVDALAARLAGPAIPFWWRFRLSPATVAYVVGLALLASVVVGVVPALKVTGRRMQARLRELGGGTGIRMGRTWTALIVAQVAVAVTVLPLTVALGWREFVRPGMAGPGLAADALLSARIGLDAAVEPGAADAPARAERARRFAARQAELARRLEAQPGVAGVAFASHVPGDWIWDSGASGTVELAPSAPGGEPATRPVTFLQVDPGLFDVYRVPILAGRPFRDADADAGAGTGAGATAVIANRSFVEQVLGGGEALGRRFRYARTEGGVEPGGVKPGAWYEIVGVVGDFPARRTLHGEGVPTLYHPLARGAVDPVRIVVRTRGIAPDRLAPRVREVLTALDPALRLSDVRTVAQLQRQRLRTERGLTLAIALVALSVLLLSAGGVHALMSFTVAQRRREVGIRSALGAPPGRILSGVFSRALRQLSLGVALGALVGGGMMLADGFPAGRAALLLLAVGGIVLAVGLLAALGPARRGLRIEPTEALRAEL